MNCGQYVGGTEVFTVAGTGVSTNGIQADFSSSSHTLPAVKGLTAAKPATCGVGELYFATDATAGQNLFMCTASNTWTQQLNSGASGATVALNNLSGVAINSSLTPGTDNAIDLGGVSARYRNAYMAGSERWTNGSGTADTGISRSAAGTISVDDGTPGDGAGNIVASGIATGSASVPAFHGLTFPQITAPVAPSGTTQNLWVDGTDLRFHDEGAAGTIGTTSVAKNCATHQWIDAMSIAGVFACLQPASTDLSDTANLVYNNAVNTGTAAMTVNLSASTVADAFRTESKAGATSGANGSFLFDSTAKNYHGFCNGADCIIPGFASAPTTGDVVTANRRIQQRPSERFRIPCKQRHHRHHGGNG